jgi:uncharacterized protein (TIGR02996 family)
MTKADWLKQLQGAPDDKGLLLAYADWLEEQGDLLEAFAQRESAGVGRRVYLLGCKSVPGHYLGPWQQLAHMRSHIRNKVRAVYGGPRKYHFRVPRGPGKRSEETAVRLDELFVLVRFEYTPVDVATMPLGLK